MQLETLVDAPLPSAADCLSKVLSNKSIPSPPAVAARILELVAQSESTVEEMTHAISADPRLASRLIAYCNSPIVGSKREIGSINQAVVVLGQRKLRLISLSFSLLQMSQDDGFDYDNFWRRSLATAIAAQVVGERTNGNAQESFLQGLVLDVGEIGLANTYRDVYDELSLAARGSVDIHDEQRHFGDHRYRVGAKLLNQWNFPTEMIQILDEFDPEKTNHRTRPFRLAQMIAELLISDHSSTTEIDHARLQARMWFEMDGVAFAEIFESALDLWNGYEPLFQFQSLPFDSLGEMEDQAKERLLAMAMEMDTQLSEAKIEVESMKESALVDGLTKLKNRHAYAAEVPGLVEYHHRQSKSFGILVIDIDHFKPINDTYGHAAGDTVLKAIGKTLQQNCRKYDTVYRYGGEEFVAAIVDANKSSIDAIADRFRKAIEDLSVDHDEHEIRVTASIGICFAENGNISTLDELFNIADGNLYQAKHDGRNRCVGSQETIVGKM